MAESHQNNVSDLRDVIRLPEYLVQNKDGLWHGEFNGYRLRSTFQPIYRRGDGCTLDLEGFEGLVRPIASGLDYSADDFFSSVSPEESFVADWICRAIHFRNFALSGGGQRKLFVNISPMNYQQFVDSAYDFKTTPDRLARFGLAMRQAVFEIIETDSMDFQVLQDVVAIYREMGASIALDDFGSKHSNIDRMVALSPDVVKLDYSLLREASNRDDVGKLVRSLIAMAGDFGSEVLVEGIENREEFDFAMSTSALMLQGYFLGTPSPRIQMVPTKLDVRNLI
ncbi:MAG: EAL domain-containing protein [Rhizobiaceae bacterium]